MEQKLWVKFVVVFLHAGVSAVLPLLATLLSHNAWWLMLYPAITAGWQTLETWLQGRGLLGAGKWH